MEKESLYPLLKELKDTETYHILQEGYKTSTAMNVVVGYGNIYTRNRIVYLKKFHILHYYERAMYEPVFMYYKNYTVVFHNGFNL